MCDRIRTVMVCRCCHMRNSCRGYSGSKLTRGNLKDGKDVEGGFQRSKIIPKSSLVYIVIAHLTSHAQTIELPRPHQNAEGLG